MKTQIVEAFGKFLAEINGNIVTFDDKSACETAVVLSEQSEAMTVRVDAYCTARGLVDKNAVAKKRIILDFLAFEATGGDVEDEGCYPAEEVEDTEL